MTKFFFSTICLLFTSTVLGQIIIENKLTDEHLSIIGTKISIIPPKDFKKASNFFGFQQNEGGSSLMIVEMAAPFSESSKGMTKEGLLSQSVTVTKIERITINKLPGILITGEQNAYGITYGKFILMFGSDKETVMINGSFPDNLEEIGNAVKQSIQTAFYEADKKINPFETVDFEIDVSKSKLIFALSIANNLLYTVDGIAPTKSSDKTNLIVGKSYAETKIEDTKLYSLNRLKKTPIEIEKIEMTEPITIDGISGYEILATGKFKGTGEPQKVYMVMLFSDNLYYILVGTTNNNFEKNIEELKNAIKTFKRK